MLDDELRDQLADWARSAERLLVPDVAIVQSRVRRRRLRIGSALAGLTAVAAAAAVVATVLAAPAAHPKPAVPWYPAGPPPPADAGPEAAPYVVTLASSPDSPAAVTAWATGTQLSDVLPPGGGTFVGVAAADDDRTFVLEEDGGDIEPAAFYELRLKPDGHPLPLTRLAIPAATMAKARSAAAPNPLLDPVLTAGRPPVSETNAFALSPDGRNLAVVVTVRGQNAIDVVSLPTGQVQEWRMRSTLQWEASLAWAGNRYLAFTSWLDKSRGWVVRLLDTSNGSMSRAIAGNLSHIQGFGSGFLINYLVSPDGSALFVAYVGKVKIAIFQISLRTGQPVRVILHPIRHGVTGPFCAVLWSDPSGRSVAATCGSSEEGDLEQGVVTDGRLQDRPLNLPSELVVGYAPGDFVAW